AMFASDILMPNPNGIASGATEAVEALKANPINAGAKIEWSPVRVAVSGDGRHGFTAGFMTMHRADGTLMPLKYLAYWEKKPEGWRVLAYKRGQAKEVPAAMAVSYVLPKQIVEPAKDASTIEQYRNSLAAAETAFSNDAQKVGIGVAFTKYGSSEAINLGGLSTPTFVMGNEAIGASVGGGEPASSSPVRWGPDVRTIVAASGDFGVTIGHIYPNAPGPDPSTSSGQAASPAGRPFFTIWRKDAGGVWRYIAE
ncbi:MAG TPA: hypothetical protein VM096_20585, partial [Vicinamibacterales bacterium]|nr:hypothetical protein [Vicinamibacterales bacterium]